MYKRQVLLYALHRLWKAVEIWQLNSSYRWVELRFIYPQDGSHSYHISRLMDWEMKAERLGGSPENVGVGMLRKDNNPWGARKEFRPGPRKAGRGDSASLRRRASWTQLSGLSVIPGGEYTSTYTGRWGVGIPAYTFIETISEMV